jgi:hypothetical protein
MILSLLSVLASLREISVLNKSILAKTLSFKFYPRNPRESAAKKLKLFCLFGQSDLSDQAFEARVSVQKIIGLRREQRLNDP